jgi:Tol biopolymer transport system component
MNVWRMNSDGGNSRQLTNGNGEKFPSCSSDGKWVVYTSVDDWTLWKVSVDGGEPVRLTRGQSRAPSVSPDGQWIAYLSREPQTGGIHRYRIVLIPFAGGPSVRTFDFPECDSHDLLLRWTPDGEAVTYIIERGGVSNVWRQPIAGGQPVPLTDFESDQIFDFGFSSDGAQLVCTRGLWASDVFLIKSIK